MGRDNYFKLKESELKQERENRKKTEDSLKRNIKALEDEIKKIRPIALKEAKNSLEERERLLNQREFTFSERESELSTAIKNHNTLYSKWQIEIDKSNYEKRKLKKIIDRKGKKIDELRKNCNKRKKRPTP